MKGEYQSGWSFPLVMRNSDPSDDWCSVLRTTPSTVSATVALSAQRRARLIPSHSNTAGLNSSASTVAYSITHQATSKSTEVTPWEKRMGTGRFQGRPRSSSSPSTTNR